MSCLNVILASKLHEARDTEAGLAYALPIPAITSSKLATASTCHQSLSFDRAHQSQTWLEPGPALCKTKRRPILPEVVLDMSCTGHGLFCIPVCYLEFSALSSMPLFAYHGKNNKFTNVVSVPLPVVYFLTCTLLW